MHKIDQITSVTSSAFHRMVKEDCLLRAASLAYATLFTLVPFLMVFVTLLSFIPSLRQAGEQIQVLIIHHFVANSAQEIQHYLNDFVGHMRYLSLPMLAAYTFFALLMLANVANALNKIWNTPQRRRWWLRWLVRVLLLLISPLLLSVGFMLSGHLVQLPIYHGQSLAAMVPKHWLWFWFNLVNVMCFTLLNWLLPDVEVPFSAALLTGLVTAVLFGLAKRLFGLYIAHFNMYHSLYGALAVIPVFLLWIYVSWLVILFGALFGHYYLKARKLV